MPFEPVEIQDPVIRCYLALNGPRYLLFDRDNASDDVFWALAPDLGIYTLDAPGYVIWDRGDLRRDAREGLQPDDLILDLSEIEALEGGDYTRFVMHEDAIEMSGTVTFDTLATLRVLAFHRVGDDLEITLNTHREFRSADRQSAGRIVNVNPRLFTPTVFRGPRDAFLRALGDALEDAKALQEVNARYRRQLPDTAHLLRSLKSPHPVIVSTIIAHEDAPEEVLAEIARTSRFDRLLLERQTLPPEVFRHILDDRERWSDAVFEHGSLPPFGHEMLAREKALSLARDEHAREQERLRRAAAKERRKLLEEEARVWGAMGHPRHKVGAFLQKKHDDTSWDLLCDEVSNAHRQYPGLVARLWMPYLQEALSSWHPLFRPVPLSLTMALEANRGQTSVVWRLARVLNLSGEHMGDRIIAQALATSEHLDRIEAMTLTAHSVMLCDALREAHLPALARFMWLSPPELADEAVASLAAMAQAHWFKHLKMLSIAHHLPQGWHRMIAEVPFTRLETLAISSASLEPEALETLLTELPAARELRSLFLSGSTMLGGELLPLLERVGGRLDALTTLDVKKCGVSAEELAAIARLPSMQNVEILS